VALVAVIISTTWPPVIAYVCSPDGVALEPGDGDAELPGGELPGAGGEVLSLVGEVAVAPGDRLPPGDPLLGDLPGSAAPPGPAGERPDPPMPTVAAGTAPSIGTGVPVAPLLITSLAPPSAISTASVVPVAHATVAVR
jgi:hypothetical protein